MEILSRSYHLVCVIYPRYAQPPFLTPICAHNRLFNYKVIYFFFPETARLSLEEIAKNFGEEVAVDVTAATEEEKAKLEETLISADVVKTAGLPATAKTEESA